MLRLEVFTFNPFQENTYLLYDETGECVIIDPGCYDTHEQFDLKDFIETNALRVTALWNTHCHIDHVLGNAFVKHQYGVKLYIHAKDEPVLRAVPTYASNYGFVKYEPTEPDGYFEEGQEVSVGNEKLKVIFTPGHAPGHIVFYHPESKIIIGGDVLFYNSIGRTDLPGGDHDTLIESIHQKLFTLPDDVTVYPGHGPETTIGHEKRTNPFCGLNA